MTTAFDLNREADVNVVTSKVELDYDDYALDLMGASVVASSTFSSKYPSAGAINGNLTHRNFGLDVADPGYDEFFPSLNGWKSAAFSSVLRQYEATKLPDMAYPPWTVINVNSAATISAGVLNVSIPGAAGGGGNYQFFRNDSEIYSGDCWLKFYMRMDAGAYMSITFCNGTDSKLIEIWGDGGGSPSIIKCPVTMESYGFNAIAAYHLYEFRLNAGVVEIYIDSVLQITSTTEGPGSPVVAFNCNSQTLGAGPDSIFFDYVYYSIPGTEYLTIDMGRSRNISKIELYDHPIEGCNTSYLLQTSVNGTTWTTIYDISRIESFNRNNSPVPVATSAYGTITTNARVNYVYFTTVACRYIRVQILAATDGYARMLEVKATTVLDITVDVLSVNCSQKMTYNLKKYMSRSCNISLRNYESLYSPEINTELRPNLEVRVYTGFSDTNVQIGRFFIDSFDINVEGKEVTLTCRDYFKQFVNTTITTALLMNYSAEMCMEYMANFCNFSSSMIYLDATGSSFQYWYPADVQVLGEMQKVTEALGLQSFYMTETGILRMKIDIDTTGETLLSTSMGASWRIYASKKVGNSIYCITKGATGTVTSQLIKYNLDTRQITVWNCNAGGAGVTTAYDLVYCNGNIYLYLQDSLGGPTGLFKFDETLVTFTLVCTHVLQQLQSSPTEIYGNFGSVCYSWDTVGLAETNRGGPATAGIPTYIYYSATALWYSMVYVTTNAFIYRNDSGSTWTQVADLTPLIQCFDMNEYGGLLYFIASHNPFAGQTDFYVWTFDGTTLTPKTGFSFPTIQTQVQVFQSPSACVDNKIWYGIASTTATDPSTFAYYYDVLLNTNIKVFALAEGTGNNPLSGIFSYNSVYFFVYQYSRIAASYKFFTAASLTPAFVFSYNKTLLKLNTKLSDESGGDSLIVTRAVVTSTPIKAGTLAVQWEHPSLPLIMAPGDQFVFQILLSNPCIVPLTVNITWSTTGWGETATITDNPTSPILTITAGSASVNVTALTISGVPFLAEYTLQAVEDATDPLLKFRYGDRRFVLNNDYINISVTPTLIAQAIVGRFGKVVSWISSLMTVLCPQVQVGDRVTVTETTTGTNADYFVISITHNIAPGSSAYTTLNLIKAW